MPATSQQVKRVHVPPMTTEEAAEYLGITPRHVRRFRQERVLRAIKIGGSVRFDIADLDALIEAGREQ